MDYLPELDYGFSNDFKPQQKEYDAPDNFPSAPNQNYGNLPQLDYGTDFGTPEKEEKISEYERLDEEFDARMQTKIRDREYERLDEEFDARMQTKIRDRERATNAFIDFIPRAYVSIEKQAKNGLAFVAGAIENMSSEDSKKGGIRDQGLAGAVRDWLHESVKVNEDILEGKKTFLGMDVGKSEEIKDKRLWDNPKLMLDEEYLIRTFNDGLAGIAPAAVAFTLASGSALVASAVIGFSSAADFYQDITRDDGVTEQEALTGAVIMGGLSSYLNKIGLDKILAKTAIKGLRAAFKVFGIKTATEMTTEYVENIVYSVTKSITKDGISNPGAMDKIEEAIKESATNAEVLLTSGMIGGAMSGVSMLRNQRQQGDTGLPDNQPKPRPNQDVIAEQDVVPDQMPKIDPAPDQIADQPAPFIPPLPPVKPTIEQDIITDQIPQVENIEGQKPLNRKDKAVLKDINESLASGEIDGKEALILIEANPNIKHLKPEIDNLIEAHKTADTKRKVPIQDPVLPDIKYTPDYQAETDYLQSNEYNEGTKQDVKASDDDLKLQAGQIVGEGVSVKDIHSFFKEQTVTITPEGHVSVLFKNGHGIVVERVKGFDDGTVEYALKSGQMDGDGRVLGSQKGGIIKVDADYATKGTIPHEVYHRLKDLGMVTEAEGVALRREMRNLLNKKKLDFEPSKAKDGKVRLEENEANVFSQILKNRNEYRGTKLGKIIQKITDFLDGLLKLNRSSSRRLAKQFESEKVFSRKATKTASNELNLMMAGRKALKHNKVKEAEAIRLLDEGKSEQAVWEKTGFIRDADGKMKFEIDDSKAEVKIDVKAGLKGKTLGDVLEHKKLYENYPQLKDIPVEFLLTSDKGFTKGRWSVKKKIISLLGGKDNVKTALAHETQHGIQQHEGHAFGGSPKTFIKEFGKLLEEKKAKAVLVRKNIKNLKNKTDKKSQIVLTKLTKGLEQLDKKIKVLSDSKKVKSLAYKKYRKILGEAESFDTMERIDLTPEQRKKILPYTSQKIAKKDYIITEARGGALPVKSPVEPGIVKTRRGDKLFDTKEEYQEILKKELDYEIDRIESFRKYHGLTLTDVKTLAPKPLHRMYGFEFDELATKMSKFAEKKNLIKEERSTIKFLQQEKEIINEKNLRDILKLPPVRSMNFEQLKNYSNILNAMDTGDTIFSEKRIKSLKGSFLEGEITLSGVIKKAAKEYNLTEADLKNISYKWTDYYRFSTPLAERSAFHKIMVDDLKTNSIKSMRKYFSAKNKLDELAKAALKSRPRSLKEKLTNTQENVMTYIEGDTATRLKMLDNMTNEEVKLADYVSSFYKHAYQHLLQNEDLSSSRHKDAYIMHAKRPLLEAVLDMKPSNFKTTLKEIVRSWKKDNAFFSTRDTASGTKLGYRKFMTQTLRRSGELVPSKNIIRSTEIYMGQFYRKQGLDKSIPLISTLAKALAVDNPNGANFENFVKEYLNTKKGQRVTPIKGFHQDGVLDIALRSLSSFLSLRYIAGNLPLQAAAIGGETMAKLPAIGARKLLLANKRKLTPQGKKIIKKYEHFIGKSVLKELGEPGQLVGDKTNQLLYGVLKWTRKITNQDILLGNMTKTEFENGTISPKRLSKITREAGRFLDIEGSKSIIGSTSFGGSFTKFRGWYIPMVSTVSTDVAALTRSVTRLGDKNKRLTKKQAKDFYRIGESVTILGLATLAFGKYVDEDDDSYAGKFKRYIMRDLATMVAGLNPATFVSAGVTLAFLERLGRNIKMITTFDIGGNEKDKEKAEKRRAYGWTGLKKQFKPTVIETIVPSKKSKRDAMKQFTYDYYIARKNGKDTKNVKADIDAYNEDIEDPKKRINWKTITKRGLKKYVERK